MQAAAPTSMPLARWKWASAWLLLCFLWLSQASGVISSNDGSHFALARSLILSGTPRLQKDFPLTLRVDWARYEGEAYSDRPPGTALLALPAVWLGNQLDPLALAAARARGELLLRPASDPFLATYRTRFPDAKVPASWQASAALIALHTAFFGLFGLFALRQLLLRMQIRESVALAICFATGAATLYGPYATVLFSHGSTLAIFSIFLAAMHVETSNPSSSVASSSPRYVVGVLAGLLLTVEPQIGGWVAILLFLHLWRQHKTSAQAWILAIVGFSLGLTPLLIYHYLAFGAPWRTGYQFHATFEFAHGFRTTFDGELLAGLWAQWGANSTGMLGQAPWLVIGTILGLTLQHRHRRAIQQLFLCGLAWFFLLAKHHTPTAGASHDARYISAAIIPMAICCACTLDYVVHCKRRWLVRGTWAVFLILVGFSAISTWSHFFGQHEATFGESTAFALIFTAPLAGCAMLLAELRPFRRFLGNSTNNA